MSGLAYQDGAFVAPGRLRVDPDDAGWLHGDGLFETLLVRRGRIVDLDAHLDRLLRGLGRLGIAVAETRAELAGAAERVAGAAAEPRSRMRITVTRGVPDASPTRWITVRPWHGVPTPERGVALARAEGRLCSDHPLRGLKSLSYQPHAMALRAARRQGAWDAVWLNERERVVEGSRSSLVARFADEVVTPPEEDGCLPGTVRRRLLEAAIVHERSLTFDELLGADELLVTNSLVGVLPVRSLAGRVFEPGPAGEALRRHWEETWLRGT